MKNEIIYLVPGFFGFTNLGSLNYFRGVKDLLQDSLKKKDSEFKIVECSTQPTGSITKRAVILLEQVIQSGGMDADPLHFVGHSTGGLDVRLLLTPYVKLSPYDYEKTIGNKTKTATFISTPHYGTPLANYFTTIQGKHLLQILSLLATKSGGKHLVFMAAKILSMVAKLDDWTGRRETFLDELSNKLLNKMSLKKNDPLFGFLEEIASDQGAIIQLTPEGMNLFNAAVSMKPEISYNSIITATSAPSITDMIKNLQDTQSAVTGSLFLWLQLLAGREHRHYPYPYPDEERMKQINKEHNFIFNKRANDGIVPALSQIYGEKIFAVKSDHLDVVGQFQDAQGNKHSDWLPSGSGFDKTRFIETWQQVASFILQKT
ncbi:MAG: esterase/lipase family protein [Myxococcota bacterium]